MINVEQKLEAEIREPRTRRLRHQIEEENKEMELSNQERMKNGREIIEETANGEIQTISLEKCIREVGEFVVVKYEGSYFPGTIIETTKEEAKVSTMQKSLKSWKWPEIPEVTAYTWTDIVEHIKPPKCISKKGFYSIPAMSKFGWA